MTKVDQGGQNGPNRAEYDQNGLNKNEWTDERGGPNKIKVDWIGLKFFYF